MGGGRYYSLLSLRREGGGALRIYYSCPAPELVGAGTSNKFVGRESVARPPAPGHEGGRTGGEEKIRFALRSEASLRDHAGPAPEGPFEETTGKNYLNFI